MQASNDTLDGLLTGVPELARLPGRDLVEVARYLIPLEASLVQGCLVASGIPAVWIWRYPPPHPYYHSAGDTPRWVDFTLLAVDAQASAATTWRLANP